MNHIKFKEIVNENCLLLLTEKNYKLKKNTIGAIIFEKKHETKIYSIGVYYSNYQDSFIVRSIGAGITFLEIETIYAPIVVKNELVGKSLKPDTNSTIGISKIPGFENRDYSRYNESITITDERGIDVLVERFKEYYHDIASPAFEAFTSIEQFVPIIRDMNIIELSDYFGMGAIFKKAIVYKLCNVAEYGIFMNERIEAFEKVIATGKYDVDTPKWYNTAIELKEILDNTPPKYNI